MSNSSNRKRPPSQSGSRAAKLVALATARLTNGESRNTQVGESPVPSTHNDNDERSYQEFSEIVDTLIADTNSKIKRRGKAINSTPFPPKKVMKTIKAAATNVQTVNPDQDNDGENTLSSNVTHSRNVVNSTPISPKKVLKTIGAAATNVQTVTPDQDNDGENTLSSNVTHSRNVVNPTPIPPKKVLKTIRAAATKIQMVTPEQVDDGENRMSLHDTHSWNTVNSIPNSPKKVLKTIGAAATNMQTVTPDQVDNGENEADCNNNSNTTDQVQGVYNAKRKLFYSSVLQKFGMSVSQPILDNEDQMIALKEELFNDFLSHFKELEESTSHSTFGENPTTINASETITNSKQTVSRRLFQSIAGKAVTPNDTSTGSTSATLGAACDLPVTTIPPSSSSCVITVKIPGNTAIFNDISNAPDLDTLENSMALNPEGRSTKTSATLGGACDSPVPSVPSSSSSCDIAVKIPGKTAISNDISNAPDLNTLKNSMALNPEGHSLRSTKTPATLGGASHSPVPSVPSSSSSCDIAVKIPGNTAIFNDISHAPDLNTSENSMVINPEGLSTKTSAMLGGASHSPVPSSSSSCDIAVKIPGNAVISNDTTNAPDASLNSLANGMATFSQSSATNLSKLGAACGLTVSTMSSSLLTCDKTVKSNAFGPSPSLNSFPIVVDGALSPNDSSAENHPNLPSTSSTSTYRFLPDDLEFFSLFENNPLAVEVQAPADGLISTANRAENTLMIVENLIIEDGNIENQGEYPILQEENVEEIAVQNVDVVEVTVMGMPEENVLAEPFAEGDPALEPRKRNVPNWQRNKLKLARDSGKAYISSSGKNVNERTIGVGCNAKCKRHCHENFTEDRRQHIFDNFWSLKSHVKQWAAISAYVRATPVKKRTVVIEEGVKPRRMFSYSYVLPVDGIEKPVCQKFFLDTLGINAQWVKTAMKKKMNKGIVSPDKRGKNSKVTELSAEVRLSIVQHNKKFPCVESHYTRKSSKCKYLDETLNRRKMHSMYCMEMAGKEKNRVASLRQYRDVFKSDFRLKFFKPKKDQCSKCLAWKNKTPAEKTDAGQKKMDEHLSSKEESRKLKMADMQLVKDAENRKKLCVVTCDLQQLLSSPKGENSLFYYKSKLSAYNFTVYVSGEQKGICYVWDQTIAKKGCAEITSCLWDFICTKVKEGITEIHIYSDNCAAQNKNQFLYTMYVMASVRFKIQIVHRYLETGHTHMPCDSVHARIEGKARNIEVYTPMQWYNIIRSAKVKPPQYDVKEMTQQNIFDFQLMEDSVCWKKIQTSKIREIIINGQQPGLVKFRYDFKDNSVKEEQVIVRGRGRPINWSTHKLTRKYFQRIPVPKKVLDGLQELCHKGAIPTAYTSYYLETLPAISSDQSSRNSNNEISDEEEAGEASTSHNSESSSECESSSDEDEG